MKNTSQPNEIIEQEQKTDPSKSNELVKKEQLLKIHIFVTHVLMRQKP